QPTDVIVSVDSRPVRTPDDLRRLIGRHRPGDLVRLGLRNARELRQVAVKTAADPQDSSRPVIGVFVLAATEVQLPISVKIDTGSIGGPSAGLAFALDVL